MGQDYPPTQDPSQGAIAPPSPTQGQMPGQNPRLQQLLGIAQIAAPLIGAVAAGSNPALARGVNAFGNMAQIGMSLADRNQRLKQQQYQYNLLMKKQQGTLENTDRLDKLTSGMEDSVNQSASTQVPYASSGPDLPQGMTPDNVPRLRAIVDQAKMAANSGQYEDAYHKALEARGYIAAVNPQDAITQAGQLPPGAEFKAPTRLGELTLKPPADKWMARTNEIVIAPPGAKGPMGEDISGKPSLAQFNERTGDVRYVGAAGNIKLDPATEAMRGGMPPAQALGIEHPGLQVAQFKADHPADTGKTTARSDRSFQFSSKQLDTMGGPVQQLATRMSRLNDSLNQQSPIADALIAPELVSVIAGGAGSGVRITQPEINNVMGGRSNWESLKAAANKWSLNPATANSITPSQRQQIRALVGVVNGKMQQKLQAIGDAQSQLINSDDPTEHRQIVDTARKAVLGVDMGHGGAPAGGGGGSFAHTATGPGGQRVGSNDGVHWVPIQ